MHAQWTPTYTVTFHPVGGSPVPVQQTVTAGGTVSEPTPPARAVKGLFAGTVANVTTLTITFQGWYTDPAYTTTAWNFNNTVTEPIDLYAKWSEPVVDLDSQTGDNILEKALNYIKTNPPAVTTNYTIVLDEDCSMNGGSYANINAANAVITLLGKDSPRTISLSSSGSLFRISAGELILDNNVTLKGLTTNNSTLVGVQGSSASLRMKAGAKIAGNSVTMNGGGGVYVTSGSSFTMEGGEISDNSANGGGGVVVNNGSFTMEGGEISGNSASSGGGGVAVYYNGSFTMSGTAKISGNSANFAGGVYVYDSSFSKTGNSVIYGDNDTTNTSPENTAASGVSHAVFYYKDDSNRYYRDTTLNANDDISTANVPATAEGTYDATNWIKMP
jgi:uncharacterized repeat protein (TIGR02543 family)